MKVVYVMSFFSSSSSRKPYKNGHHGNNHYQRKGMLGKLFHALGSGSHSGRHYNDHPQHPQQYAHEPNQRTQNQNATICTNCHQQIPAGSKFCLECGAKVNTNLVCVNCGENLPPNAKFCSKCGTKVSA
jgi:ribosomal protein L40E